MKHIFKSCLLSGIINIRRCIYLLLEQCRYDLAKFKATQRLSNHAPTSCLTASGMYATTHIHPISISAPFQCRHPPMVILSMSQHTCLPNIRQPDWTGVRDLDWRACHSATVSLNQCGPDWLSPKVTTVHGSMRLGGMHRVPVPQNHFHFLFWGVSDFHFDALQGAVVRCLVRHLKYYILCSTSGHSKWRPNRAVKRASERSKKRRLLET